MTTVYLGAFKFSHRPAPTARTDTTTPAISHGLRAQSRRHICRRDKNTCTSIIIFFISEATTRQHQRKDAVDPTSRRVAHRQRRAAIKTSYTARVWQSESHSKPSQESSSGSLSPTVETCGPESARVTLQPILCPCTAERTTRHGPAAICPSGAARILHARPGKTTNYPARAKACVLFPRHQHIFPNGRSQASQERH